MKSQNFSLNQIKKEQKFIRENFGKQSVEAHSHVKMVEATHLLDQFFDVKTKEFTEKVGESEVRKVERPVAYIKDVEAINICMKE